MENIKIKIQTEVLYAIFLFKLKLLSANLRQKIAKLYSVKARQKFMSIIVMCYLTNIWLIKEIKTLLKILLNRWNWKKIKDMKLNFLWKENLKSNLPDNYLLAKSRLESPQKRFLKNKKPFEEYDNIFQQYLKDNLIGKVPNEETDTLSCNFHYLPRREVIRNYHITTKLRIIFDASAHYTTELCLNVILDAGPYLLPYLLDILLRFRTGKIAVVADIRQAFC